MRITFMPWPFQLIKSLEKRIKELEDEKVEFLAYAGCSSFPDVIAKIDSLAYHAQVARNELDAWLAKKTP